MVRTVDFLRELMLPFVSNKVLVEGLAKSEVSSFRPEDHIIWHVHHGSDQISLGNGSDWYTDSRRALSSVVDELDHSPMVGIPGGMIGKQAFFLILENFWRNLVKHNRAAVQTLVSADSRVEIHVELADDDVREFFWYLTLWSSLENEAEDVRRIKGVLNEGIINHKGELIPEGWGTKEMYTAAAHLRGLPISRLLSFQYTNENGENEDILGVHYFGDHIVYSFRLLKPLQLQIVTSESQISEVISEGDRSEQVGNSSTGQPDLEEALASRGIYLRSSLPAEQVVPTEYLVVDPRARLDEPEDSLLPIKRSDKMIDISTLNHEEAYSEELVDLERRFAEKIIEDDDRKIHFVVDGQEGDDEIICHLDSYNKLSSSKYYDRISDINVSGVRKKLEDGFFCVIFDRHGDNFDKPDAQRENVKNLARDYNQLFWEPYGGGTHTAFTLQHLPSTSAKKTHLAWSLVSSALLKVVILDERIQQALVDSTWGYGDGPEIDCLRCLEMMRIFIPSRKDSGNDDFVGLNLEGPDAAGGKTSDFQNRIKKYIGEVKPHLVSIHAGILDKMGYKEPDDVEDYIQHLNCKINQEQEVGRVIIHSGRGIPPNVPQLRVPFIGYTSVEHWLTSKDLKSKHGLVQELLSARGMKR